MRVTALLVLCLAQSGVAAFAGEQADAMRAIEAYSAALNRYDCSAMVELLSPAVTKRLRSQPSGEAAVCKFAEFFRAAGAREFLRAPTASLSRGRYRMLVVPNTRMAYMAEVGAPTLYEGTYVVHSSDGGRSWHVLDLACLSKSWVKEVYPPYAGKPRLGPASQETLALRNDL
jgi:hypothetical protein